jgi:hypothetical protein
MKILSCLIDATNASKRSQKDIYNCQFESRTQRNQTQQYSYDNYHDCQFHWLFKVNIQACKSCVISKKCKDMIIQFKLYESKNILITYRKNSFWQCDIYFVDLHDVDQLSDCEFFFIMLMFWSWWKSIYFAFLSFYEIIIRN